MSGNSRVYRMHKNGRMWEKTPHVAALQDLLVWVTKGLSAVTTQMRREDLNVTGEINQLITKNLFTTITNANFDPEMITSQIEKTLQIKKCASFTTEKSGKIAGGCPMVCSPF